MIGLPANIFYGTSIPTCILVFKKCRENPEDILFIDASGSDHFEKVKNQNILRREDIAEIVETYSARVEKDRYSHVAPLVEVAENDYNLNIPRYVDTFNVEEQIDLDAVLADLKAVDADLTNVDSRFAVYCTELGLEFPL